MENDDEVGLMYAEKNQDNDVFGLFFGFFLN